MDPIVAGLVLVLVAVAAYGWGKLAGIREERCRREVGDWALFALMGRMAGREKSRE